jgi:hypothetical protein
LRFVKEFSHKDAKQRNFSIFCAMIDLLGDRISRKHLQAQFPNQIAWSSFGFKANWSQPRTGKGLIDPKGLGVSNDRRNVNTFLNQLARVNSSTAITLCMIESPGVLKAMSSAREDFKGGSTCICFEGLF